MGILHLHVYEDCPIVSQCGNEGWFLPITPDDDCLMVAFVSFDMLSLLQDKDIVDYGIKTWLGNFKTIEKKLTDYARALKALLVQGKALASKYKMLFGDGQVPYKSILEDSGPTMFDQCMVTCSEALLLRALASQDPIGEVRQQLSRMQDMQVKPVNNVVLAHANKLLTTGH